MATWRDYAPEIGAGVLGSVLGGSFAALIGERRKRIRNVILGAIAGGLGGAAIGNHIKAYERLKKVNQEQSKLHEEWKKKLQDYFMIVGAYDDTARKLGIKPNKSYSPLANIIRDESLRESAEMADALDLLISEKR